MRKVGITGGIGSGKSSLCELFAQKGVAIYNSDAKAKELMSSEQLQKAISERFGAQAYCDGVLNRQYLAERVFNNDEELKALNAIVHPAVVEDFKRWTDSQDGAYIIFECAILFEAGFGSLVDVTIAVLAPEALRIERVMKRDSVSEAQVRARIKAQLTDDELSERADTVVVNIFEDDLQGVVTKLDTQFRYANS